MFSLLLKCTCSHYKCTTEFISTKGVPCAKTHQMEALSVNRTPEVPGAPLDGRTGPFLWRGWPLGWDLKVKKEQMCDNLKEELSGLRDWPVPRWGGWLWGQKGSYVAERGAWGLEENEVLPSVMVTVTVCPLEHPPGDLGLIMSLATCSPRLLPSQYWHPGDLAKA